jgi:hypothetical protein
MANHRIPRTALAVERIHGIDADGNVVTLAAYRHTRAGHADPMFYVVQYREVSRRIDRGSRVTREFTGPDAAARLEDALTESRDLLAESRERAAASLTVALR